jgi:XTP/dITP diphosphohydrolase
MADQRKRILILATRNEGKVREIRSILGGLDLEVRSLANYPDLPDVDEDGRTFAENAVKKATAIALAARELALADDSGLVVDALAGRPGVHSSRYAPSSAERNARLLRELNDVPLERRTARFVCVAALADAQGHAVTREGTCEGRIALAPRGAAGFGYDPVFLLPDRGETMAEISTLEKNEISHRGAALRAIRAVLEDVINTHNGMIPLP